MHLVELAEDYDGIKKEPSPRYACCLPCRRCAFKVNLSRPLCICLAYCAKKRRGLAQSVGGRWPTTFVLCSNIHFLARALVVDVVGGDVVRRQW